MSITIEENISLKPLSTIRVGGYAKRYTKCKTEEEIIEALDFAHKQNLPFYVLGQGSNTLFTDEDYSGLIIHNCITGVDFKNATTGQVSANSGEIWDDFVQKTVEHGLTGIECLSGIPGYVGATPIQNVGAYGQDVSQTITSLRVIHVPTRDMVEIPSADCHFQYRNSRFKSADRGQYIITRVHFQLHPQTEPKILYHELFKYVKSRKRYKTLDTPNKKLAAIREAVLDIRKGKSMLLDDNDANSHSLGSFFLNPVIDKVKLKDLLAEYPELPYFNAGDHVKISAAWLIEQSGIRKGFRHKSASTSANHSLAIINPGKATCTDITELATIMKSAVMEKFGVDLVQEPNLVSTT